MRRFAFELEPVLQVRRREEDAATLALAEVERERLAMTERLRAIQAAIERERDVGRGALADGPVSLGDARAQRVAVLALDARARAMVVSLAGVHARLDRAREALRRAAARRESLELLRAARFEAWARDRERTEAASVDELVVMRPWRAEADG